jgi:uncharacterized membrane protein YphA (DoxX/SURF4 family)|tara:strand:- start:2222 stop:2452 length:231 start_codon:yes stop_codon:yes gene_type:complete
MVLLDYYDDVGAVILIIFTIIATAMFHRFWRVEDPIRRHLHLSFIFHNAAMSAALYCSSEGRRIWDRMGTMGERIL